MPTLIDAGLIALEKTVNAEVMAARRNVKPNWMSVAVKKSQALSTGFYPWMNDLPLIGRKQANGYIRSGISTQSFSLRSEPQGLWIEIQKAAYRDALATGNMAGIIDIAQGLGRRIEEFPQDLVFNWFKEGDQTTYLGRSNLAYDGLSFFNDAHYTNGRNTAGGTYDNNLTGTALTAANAAVMEAAGAVMPDNRGKSLNQTLVAIVVPPLLAITASEIYLARNVSTGGDNMQGPEGRAARGLAPVQIIVSPELGGDNTTWYGIFSSGGRMPVIWQETEPLRVIPMIDDTYMHVVEDDLLIWAAKGESVAGWGDPRTAIRAIA